MKCLPFYHCFKYRKKKNCLYCNSIIIKDTNYDFCDKNCELHQPKRKMRQIIYFLVSVNDLIKETNYLHLTVC